MRGFLKLDVERFREIRAQRGLSQKALADRLHVTQQAVSLMETRGTCNLLLAQRIGAILGCKVADFTTVRVRGAPHKAVEADRLLAILRFYFCDWRHALPERAAQLLALPSETIAPPVELIVALGKATDKQLGLIEEERVFGFSG